MAYRAAGRRPVPSLTSRRRVHIGALRAVMVATAFVAVASCSSSAPSGSAGTAGTAGGTRTSPTATQALLTRLAIEGSDAAFEHRYGGDLGGDGTALVFAGRRDDQAVVYVCDGTSGGWFTGTVDDMGNGTLRAVDGDGAVSLAPGGGGAQVTFDRGDFGGRSAALTALEPGDGSLIRLEANAASGGPNTAVGGIIVSATELRGVLRVTTIVDGTSNTISFSETTTSTAASTASTLLNGDVQASGPPATKSGSGGGSSLPVTQPTTSLGDGSVRTITPGTDSPASTTTSLGDGSVRTITPGTDSPASTTPTSPPTETIVSKTPNGLLTIRITVPSGTSTTTARGPCTATQATLAALIDALVVNVNRLGDQLAQLRKQRDGVTAQLASATDSSRSTLQRQLDDINRRSNSAQLQLQRLQAQIDELRSETQPCSTTSTARTR